MPPFSFARALWQVVETIHAVSYFAPQSRTAAERLGARGFWRMYFGFRAAPLGRCTAAVVEASFFGFAPAMVARAVPQVWQLADPAAYLTARADAAAEALRGTAPAVEQLADDAWVGAQLDLAAQPCAGRVLFTANRDLPRPADPVAALWQACTTLREHRGDGHNAAWVAEGLAPVEVLALVDACGAIGRASVQPNRGWTDAQWDAARDRLRERGLLMADTVTEQGLAVRAEVERRTDALAQAPYAALGPADRARLLERLRVTALQVQASGVLPHPNPIGLAPLD